MSADPRAYAELMHNGQTRKFSGLPYMIHCDSVASVVSFYDPGAVPVAYLHDTLEDTKTTYNELVHLFGRDVADDVVSLTNVPKSAGNRKARKSMDNDRLAEASVVSQTVKLSDILDNVPSMLLHKPDFGKRYLREKLDTLKVLKRAEPNLLKLTRDYLSGLLNQYGG